MEMSDALDALSALAQPTRLEAFRRLVSADVDGMAAGQLADALGVPQNTLSSHLSILASAGLVHGERQGRSIIYRAELAQFRAVMLYLLSDCCGGHPDVCAPVLKSLTDLETAKPGCC
jgi:ArsR family transcriptional regulator